MTKPKLAHDHRRLTCQPFKLHFYVSPHVHTSFLYSTCQVLTASRTECLKRARVGGHDRLVRAGQPRWILVGIPGGQGQAHPMASLVVIKLQLLSRTGSIQQPATSISQGFNVFLVCPASPRHNASLVLPQPCFQEPSHLIPVFSTSSL